MRRIFLVRHGHPDFPLDAKICLGLTELPLGPLGRMQACLLAGELRSPELLDVFSSPLLRCRQTAAALGQPFVTDNSLAEQNMGSWDGLSFETIKQHFPELYQERGQNPLLVPPGAETLSQVQERAYPALQRCVAASSGDLAIVAHASVIQAILASVMSVSLAESLQFRLQYGAYAVLEWDGVFQVETWKKTPHPNMTPELADALLSVAAPGERVEAHSRAVAEKAMEIADALPVALDRNALYCAALLHDVARTEQNHASVGAEWVKALGYGKEAEFIRQHHDLESEGLDEAAVLYLSDKCIREDKPVSIEERFENSAARCVTEEAKAAHAKRYETAKALQSRINKLCGRSVVQ